MQQEQISSASPSLDYAIFGAVVQAKDTGIIKPVYTIKELEDGGYNIAVDGQQNYALYYNKYFEIPGIEKVTVTNHEGVILNVGGCTLAVQGYLFNTIEIRYVVKLLSEPLQGMKPMQSNIKENELKGVIHEYWAIQKIENDWKNLNDKENYEVIEFEDEYISQYHLTSKEWFQKLVRAFKAKQENLIEPRANKEKMTK